MNTRKKKEKYRFFSKISLTFILEWCIMSSSTTTKHYIMLSIIYLEARREGYEISQIPETMTVGELIDYLSQFDEEAPIYLSHDMGYTYGGITQRQFEEEWVEEDEDEKDEF